MKRHERCRISGSFCKVEIPLLLSFLHLISCAEDGLRAVCVLASFLVLSTALAFVYSKVPVVWGCRFGGSLPQVLGAIRSDDSVRRGV